MFSFITLVCLLTQWINFYFPFSFFFLLKIYKVLNLHFSSSFFCSLLLLRFICLLSISKVSFLWSSFLFVLCYFIMISNYNGIYHLLNKLWRFVFPSFIIIFFINFYYVAVLCLFNFANVKKNRKGIFTIFYNCLYLFILRITRHKISLTNTSSIMIKY